MKTKNQYLAVSTLALAVQAALLAMTGNAYAADDDAEALTNVHSTIELGVVNTSQGSAKFGEYNGLDQSGASLVGNIDLRGGDAYNGGKGTSTWEVTGTDLGTTSRALGAKFSDQGRWKIGIGYDELQHDQSSTYQTPLLGGMGGNAFTLPANFGVIDTAAVTAAKGGAQALTQAQLDAFQTQDVHVGRKTTSFSAGYQIDRRWSASFDISHLDQSGAKLMSVGTDAGATAAGLYDSRWGREKIMTLMNPTNYSTDTYTLGVSWLGDKARFSASYVGSFFRDGYKSVTFPNFYATAGTTDAYPVNTLSTMPDNDLHQLDLKGSYAFSSQTRLTGGVSRGRLTQNDAYPFAMMQVTPGTTGATANPMGGGLPPQASLDGLVETTHADLKLTHQSSRDLVLSAALKYNEHDNQTASTTYNFIDLGGKNRTAVNTPLSFSKTQGELAGDYRLSSKNRLHLGVEYESVKRWCNNDLANNTVGVVPAGYTTTVNSCVQMPDSKETRLVALYKLRADSGTDFNLGYNYGKRDATVNASFYNPMQALAEGYEAAGYRAFFQAARTEQVLKSGVSWQAGERVNLGVNGRYIKDSYTDSPLGVQDGSSWNVNLDANYAYSRNGVLSAYVSVQNRERELVNLSGHAQTGANTWTNQLSDNTKTLGLNVTHKGLMDDKLELSGDLSYSNGVTRYATQVPYLATCGATTSLTCGSTPDITSKIITLKVSGNYTVDRKSRVNVAFLHQKVDSNDYYYNFYQTGYTGTGNLPTNEQPANYSINSVAVSYVYSF